MTSSNSDTSSSGSVETSDDPSKPAELPLGTSPEYARMHKFIRRVCYVLLFGLVIEGALTFPLLAIWYGFPELSAKEVCSELQKEMYFDENRECETPYSVFPGPPIGSPSEAEGQTTSQDIWGIQPVPQNERVDFRELIENQKEREAREAQGANGGAEDSDATPDDSTTTTTDPG